MTKACDISPAVKREVCERDGGRCILCGASGLPNAHFIPRARGGLGIPRNIVTLCPDCHREYDNGPCRKALEAEIRAYLMRVYSDWDESALIYHREAQPC